MSITTTMLAAAEAVTMTAETHESGVKPLPATAMGTTCAAAVVADEELNNKTGRLVNEMLSFLEYSSEEDNQTIVNKATAEFAGEIQQAKCPKQPAPKFDDDSDVATTTTTTTASSSSLESEEETLEDEVELCMKNVTDERIREQQDIGAVSSEPLTLQTASPEEQKTALDSYVMEALKKIIESYPSWNYSMPDHLADSVTVPDANNEHVSAVPTATAQCPSAAPPNCAAGSNTVDKNSLYINEIKRVLSTEPTGHPPKDSPEYYKAAERYALYGNDFDEFPQDLSTLYDTKTFEVPVQDPNTQSLLGDGLYPTPTPAELASSLAAANYAKPYGVSTIAGTTYYHHHLGLQQNWRQNLAAANNSSAIGMYLNANKLSYVPTQAAAAPTHFLYNQQTVNAANFISNSLANAALASSPLIYTNPLLAGNAQNYLQNWYQKQHAYVNNPLLPNAATMGFYERLLYAQVLQKQIYNYQTRAVAMAALYQQQQHQQQQQQQAQLHNFQYRPRISRSSVGGFTGTAPTFYNAAANEAPAAAAVNEVASTSALPQPTISLLTGDSDTSGAETDTKSIAPEPTKEAGDC